MNGPFSYYSLSIHKWYGCLKISHFLDVFCRVFFSLEFYSSYFLTQLLPVPTALYFIYTLSNSLAFLPFIIFFFSILHWSTPILYFLSAKLRQTYIFFAGCLFLLALQLLRCWFCPFTFFSCFSFILHNNTPVAEFFHQFVKNMSCFNYIA